MKARFFGSAKRTCLTSVSLMAATIGLASPAAAQAVDPAATTVDTAATAEQPAAEAAQDQAAPASQEAQGDEIIVTGFRASLNAALQLRRDSVSQVDAIVAEDIAQFPTQNLAESLQRIPGISILRDGGEGRAITVRGLGAQFTRVRLNGLETVATSTDGASVNRDRAFDFNVFAAELFNSIVVHKTAEASLDEGSLGAVVDLNTGNPLGGRAGLNGVLSVQGSYNDLSETLGPRIAGLLSWRNDAGTFGFSVSAAYSRVETLELGNNTVRWAQARFDSVNGTPCFYNFTGPANNPTYTTPRPNSGGAYRPSAVCDQAALAFHPRIPRYGEVGHDRERLGVTASIQFAPTDATRISIDGLYSRFRETRSERWAEVLFRSNERSVDVVNFVVDPETNNMVSGTFNDAWVRIEGYERQSETEFFQIGGSWDQDLAETFRFTLLGGYSRSVGDISRETTIVFDDRDAQNYTYDYTDSRFPRLTFGTSVTDPANFQLAEIRDRPSTTTNEFTTAALRTEWDVADDFQVLAGAVYRRFDYELTAFTRDTAVCGNGGTSLVTSTSGTITCSPSSAFGPTAVYGFPVTPALSQIFNLGNAGQPDGTTTQWITPNMAAATAFTNLYNRPLALDVGNNRAVTEEVKGGYLQFNARGQIAGMNYRLNAGIRYAQTDQSSTGLNGGVQVTIDRTYDDWLPAVNFALNVTDNFLIRAAVSRVMTRPTLGNLTPGGSADGFNLRVNFGNPQLEPFRATAYDLSAEWYFAPESILGVAIFRKEIASFPVAITTTGSFDSTGLPVSVLVPSSPAALDPALRASPTWQIQTIGNGEGAILNGVEFSFQAPFRFLPGLLRNFGAIANVTLVESDADYTVSGPAVATCVNATATTPCAFGPLVNAPRTSTLFGLSRRAINGTLYYDDGGFNARVSATYRSRFVDANSGTGNVFEGYNDSLNIDVAVRYQLTPNIQISIDGINLTDNYRDRFTDVDADRNYENNHFGRTIQFGVRYSL